MSLSPSFTAPAGSVTITLWNGITGEHSKSFVPVGTTLSTYLTEKGITTSNTLIRVRNGDGVDVAVGPNDLSLAFNADCTVKLTPTKAPGA